MKWPRKKYSLGNCNPPEKMKRKWINDMDFKKVFPFLPMNNGNYIEMSLLRRFLYRNKIPCERLYSVMEMECALKRYKKDPSLKPVSMRQEQVSRFELMDL